MKTIDIYTLFINDKGNNDADLMQAADGFENGVIFEIIKFHDENINPDETGEPELFYYDFKKENIQNINSDNSYKYMCITKLIKYSKK